MTNAKDYGIILLELAIPFLPIVDKDVFPKLSPVSKKIHHYCIARLKKHCEKHHPALLKLEKLWKEEDEADSSDTKWLNFGRYQSFVQTSEESPARQETWYHIVDPIRVQALNASWLKDYEVVLEVKGLQQKEDSIVVCPTPIACGVEIREMSLLVGWKELLVRVAFRRKCTGEMSIVMNQTVACIFHEAGSHHISIRLRGTLHPFKLSQAGPSLSIYGHPEGIGQFAGRGKLVVAFFGNAVLGNLHQLVEDLIWFGSLKIAQKSRLL